MDKSMIIGAALGAAVASTALVSADAVQKSVAKGVLYHVATDIPLDDNTLAFLQKVVEAKIPGCTWDHLEIDNRLTQQGVRKVMRAPCTIHAADMSTVPSGAAVEAE